MHAVAAQRLGGREAPLRTLAVAAPGWVRETNRMIVRPEKPEDIPSIRTLTDAAFVGVEHSSRTEAAIVDALRAADALTLSLVAELQGSIIGHVGFSPVLIDGRDIGWSGLGPVSVSPGLQRGGVGSALIKQGLDKLARRGAQGCVVLGDPDYYGRFGFSSDHALRYGDVPAGYFQSLLLAGELAAGEVTYHAAFEAT
ncbi:GNAT family N-acetyltransferase [Brevundimonas basaltis]|uniref:GNAT family N-acetyltransferase n=1 Tax=Brevundimonas basaltis TaxID=472166 RepID=UPI001FEC8573|nr:N-acetyltransferase [Brevundimonas basaltis]